MRLAKIALLFTIIALCPMVSAAEATHTIKASTPITYAVANPKAIVYIFTDMDCSYCRKLHHQVPALTEHGIEVRYLAYPRQGIGSRSYNEMVAIWCSKDPGKALSRAMEGERPKAQTCGNPVKEHYLLGKKLRILGTPTIVYADGAIESGYVPAAKLVRDALRHSPGS